MSRYIDADAFLTEESEAFMAAQLKVKDEATRIVNEVVHKKVQMLIADAPTVDAVPVVRGKWIKSDFLYIGANQYRCSECWKDEWWLHHFSLGDSNYCPHCGTNMDGERRADNGT